jgi:hypothetical protein
VVKNRPAYFNQGMFEVHILEVVRQPPCQIQTNVCSAYQQLTHTHTHTHSSIRATTGTSTILCKWWTPSWTEVTCAWCSSC